MNSTKIKTIFYSYTAVVCVANWALALGWTQERIVVVDTDLGQSGASSVEREGF
jgi:hypothetical protein